MGAEHERVVDPRRVESVGVPARARGLWPVDGVLHSPRQKKLVVFYNGWRLLDNCDPSNWGRTCTLNHGKCHEMVGLGFNVAVVMSYTPASALRALALCGMAPWVHVGNYVHACSATASSKARPRPYPDCCEAVPEPEPADYRTFCRAHIGSPFLNRTAYLARVKNATDALRQSQGWTAGVLDDIEQPPWPRRSWTATGSPSTYNFSDLDERLGNRPSASPDWPSFADWPVANAHRHLPGMDRLSIEALQFNNPRLIQTAQPTASLHPANSSMGSVSIAGKSNISMVSQPFQLGGNHTRLSRVDIWLQRSIPAFPSASLSFSICELNETDQTPVLERAVLCAQRSPLNPNYPEYFRSAGIWATCGVEPADLPARTSSAGWSATALYVNPASSALDPMRRYTMVLQFGGKASEMASSPASYQVGTEASTGQRFEAMVRDDGGWRALPGVALRTQLWAPADGTNRLHEDWVAFHAATTARELSAFANVATTLPAHNSTGRTMDVVAYSAYAGVGIGPAGRNEYLGDVRDTCKCNSCRDDYFHRYHSINCSARESLNEVVCAQTAWTGPTWRRLASLCPCVGTALRTSHRRAQR